MSVRDILTPEDSAFNVFLTSCRMTIGVAGILCNCLSIPILASESIGSVFNRILVLLSIFDSIFILCSIMKGVREFYGSDWQDYTFAFFGYQIQGVAIQSSIYTTVVLAIERYLAITRPVDYHNETQGQNPWRRVRNYIIPIVVFSAVFNIPKILEVKIVERLRLNESHVSDPSCTTIDVVPSDLRLNAAYIFWYVNVAKLLFTCIMPFAALCILNMAIVRAMRRRSSGSGNTASTAEDGGELQQMNVDDGGQEKVLLGIAVVFLVCNLPRAALSLHEVFAIRQYKKDALPLWLILSGKVIELLLVVNCSANFIIYCIMSKLFRKELVLWARARLPFGSQGQGQLPSNT